MSASVTETLLQQACVCCGPRPFAATCKLSRSYLQLKTARSILTKLQIGDHMAQMPQLLDSQSFLRRHPLIAAAHKRRLAFQQKSFLSHPRRESVALGTGRSGKSSLGNESTSGKGTSHPRRLFARLANRPRGAAPAEVKFETCIGAMVLQQGRPVVS